LSSSVYLNNVTCTCFE